MHARIKAGHHAALGAGWYAEAFARSKRMKPLGDYLKAEPIAEEKRDRGSARVAAMLDRMVAKQKREGS